MRNININFAIFTYYLKLFSFPKVQMRIRSLQFHSFSDFYQLLSQTNRPNSYNLPTPHPKHPGLASEALHTCCPSLLASYARLLAPSLTDQELPAPMNSSDGPLFQHMPDLFYACCVLQGSCPMSPSGLKSSLWFSTYYWWMIIPLLFINDFTASLEHTLC